VYYVSLMLAISCIMLVCW